ncbi:MAG: rod shape-determining protein MreD [Clostridia bacterium]|nr:rod shape-determining protein MreD [Clostridia bacterium]
MKRVYKILFLGLLLILGFALQVYLFNNLTIGGTKINLLLMIVFLVAMWFKPNYSITFSFIIGLLSDLIFTYSIGRFLIIYLLINILVIFLMRLYNKENIWVTAILSLIVTFILELYFWIYSIIQLSLVQNLFRVAIVSLKGGLFNVIICMLLTLVFRKFRRILED